MIESYLEGRESENVKDYSEQAKREAFAKMQSEIDSEKIQKLRSLCRICWDTFVQNVSLDFLATIYSVCPRPIMTFRTERTLMLMAPRDGLEPPT